MFEYDCVARACRICGEMIEGVCDVPRFRRVESEGNERGVEEWMRKGWAGKCVWGIYTEHSRWKER